MLIVHWVGGCNPKESPGNYNENIKTVADFIEISDMIDKIHATKTQYCKQCKENAQATPKELVENVRNS